jgi:septum formation protein
VAARRQSAGRDGELVLAADTVVVLGEGRAERLLGKPTDESHARAMLRELSGSRHRVITGVCALARGGGARREAEASGAETTWVTMRPIEPREIDAYAQSGEWQGKAGGYAIQERAERFVTRLEGGGLDNVVGLPLELALELLADAAARAGLAWSRPRA